jgi:hypothetical protein
MSDLGKELGELRSFVQYLKADRDAQKQKEEREKWTRWVSLTIVFLAVAAALANQQYGSFSGRAVRALNHAAIAQGNATNQWSYFQSVSIKLHMYKFEKRRAKKDKKPVEAGAKVEGAAPDAAAAVAKGATPEKRAKADKKEGGEKKAKKGGIDEKITKYTIQKPQIEAKARAFEKEVDAERQDSEQAQRHTKELTLALALLQVAIAVGSIAALAKKKPLWFVSMGIGAYGVFQTFNGIFLWM